MSGNREEVADALLLLTGTTDQKGRDRPISEADRQLILDAFADCLSAINEFPEKKPVKLPLNRKDHPST